ncbi:MAG TPA: putative peptide modification system cyclase, partial [Rhodanobacteraceae bacterium]|nr:putative peptide modification system cyclase [Rhodanobacteraceae bacterium]
QRDWVVVGSLKNLTDDTSFDDSLETAFRLGLEQSRYVNVLSGLKTRETVKLMQRDPDHTSVDRAIGSEIALRDGARALILPTVAEIGGRVRVTAEVIDPHTQTSVWSESADGIGAESVLPSLDVVNQKLRVRLGEALATVSSESRPLEKVATNNLDALKAYSLAQHAYDVSNYRDAMSLYRQAIKLDGDFALARIGLARSLVVADQRPEAIRELEAVSKMRERLSARDALYAEAWQLSLSDSQRAAIEKWRLLTQLYPDFFTAQGLFAFFSWEYANTFDASVIHAAEAASSPRNANAATSLLLLGMLELGNERYDDAVRTFDMTAKAGLTWHFDYALPHAARRRFDTVDTILARGIQNGAPESDVDAYVQRIAIEFDRGTFGKGRSEIANALRDTKDMPPYVRIFSGMELGIAGALEPKSTARTNALHEYAAGLSREFPKAIDGERDDLAFEVLYAGWLAARSGDSALAETLVASVPADKDTEYPVRERFRAIVKAELARAAGKPADAVALLKPTVDGAELYLAHATLMEAYAAQRDLAHARDEARWLAEHRGRAYAEYNMRQLLTPLNVVESDLALLRGAELALAAGDKASARTGLDTFLKAWPEAAASEPLSSRIRTLQKDL